MNDGPAEDSFVGHKQYNHRSRSERVHISLTCKGEGDREAVEGSSVKAKK